VIPNANQCRLFLSTGKKWDTPLGIHGRKKSSKKQNSFISILLPSLLPKALAFIFTDNLRLGMKWRFARSYIRHFVLQRGLLLLELFKLSSRICSKGGSNIILHKSVVIFFKEHYTFHLDWTTNSFRILYAPITLEYSSKVMNRKIRAWKHKSHSFCVICSLLFTFLHLDRRLNTFWLNRNNLVSLPQSDLMSKRGYFQRNSRSRNSKALICMIYRNSSGDIMWTYSTTETKHFIS
jgi:hypothetical protein